LALVALLTQQVHHQALTTLHEHCQLLAADKVKVFLVKQSITQWAVLVVAAVMSAILASRQWRQA
jgi:hypothetical protein